MLPGGEEPENNAKAEAEAEESDTEVHLLFDPVLADRNGDQDTQITAIGKVIENVERLQKDSEGDYRVRAKVVFEMEGPSTISVEAKPALSAELKNEFQNRLAMGVGYNPKVFPMGFVVDFKIGKPAKELLFEQPETDRERRFDDVKKADIVKSGNLIRNYVRSFALPIVAGYLSSADPRFKGVVGTGKMLQSLDLSKRIDVSKSVDQNADYWRGMLEMAPGIPSVISTRILLHALNGNFDHATRYLGFHAIFMDEENGVSGLMQELGELMALHDTKVLAQINKGIAQHDQGNYAEAEKIHAGVLKQYPYSAFGTYERWYAADSQYLEKENLKMDDWVDRRAKSWREIKTEIYKIDPMYPLDVHAQKPEEMFSLTRRLELKALLNQAMDAKGLLKYADIALDLEVHSFAAELYWVIRTNLEEDLYKDHNFPDRIFYCIHEAGAKGFKDLVKYDFENAQREVAAIRKKGIEAFEKEE